MPRSQPFVALAILGGFAVKITEASESSAPEGSTTLVFAFQRSLSGSPRCPATYAIGVSRRAADHVGVLVSLLFYRLQPVEEPRPAFAARAAEEKTALDRRLTHNALRNADASSEHTF
jgi:hypothetical protein